MLPSHHSLGGRSKSRCATLLLINIKPVHEIMNAWSYEYGIGQVFDTSRRRNFGPAEPMAPLLLDFLQRTQRAASDRVAGQVSLFSETLSILTENYEAAQLSAESGDEAMKKIFAGVPGLCSAVDE